MTAEPCPTCGGRPGPRALREYADRMKRERDELQARVDALTASPASARSVLEAAGLDGIAREYLDDDAYEDDEEPDDGPTDEERQALAASKALRSVQVWPDEDPDDTDERDAAAVAEVRRRAAVRGQRALEELREVGA